MEVVLAIGILEDGSLIIDKRADALPIDKVRLITTAILQVARAIHVQRSQQVIRCYSGGASGRAALCGRWAK